MRKSPEDQRQWKKWVEEAERYPGGLTAYCRKAGITVNALSYWRKKLRGQPSLSRSRPSSAFVPVQVLPAESLLRSLELPDAKWLADLIGHLAVHPSRSQR
jgi:transposase-like protein